jgi:hypothetical protein
MTDFTPRLISHNGWDVLIFDFSQLGAGRSSDEISKIPDERTIEELFSPWLGNPPSEYRFKNYMNLKSPSANSILTCRNHSNWAIKKIFLHYSDPLQKLIPHEEILRSFCNENGIPYEYVEYYLLACKYFEKMFPIPVNSTILPSLSIRLLSLPDTIQSIDADQKIVQKVDKQKKILQGRFCLYETACQQTYPIIYRFHHSDGFKKAISLIIEKGDAVSKRDNKIKNDKRRAKDDERIVPELPSDWNIRQCLFCGEFYQSQKSRDNNYSRYCDDPSCKKSYNAWRQALKNKGESFESMGL